MSRSTNYKKLRALKGIYQHTINRKYMVEKRVKGKLYSQTFTTLYDAKRWQKMFDGSDNFKVTSSDFREDSSYATLKCVWETMQVQHFPVLAATTKEVWNRRYKLLENLEHLPMNMITPSKLTDWAINWAQEFKSDEYQKRGRGFSGRCNLNCELNLLVCIFNWYKQSETFEKEAQFLTCPVKKKHRKLGFVKPLPDKRKQIDLDHAFMFFDALKPLYSDLAQMQFYTAGRIGETAGMQWKNVDLKNRRLIIKETCVWLSPNKTFFELKLYPKNREARAVFITDEIFQILKRREVFRIKGCDYIFHVDGLPLNYGTIQVNYRQGQTLSGIPYSGTHILRHGMAKLARKVGGGLDAVIAMTGHKDIKLADHYSKSNEDDQKHFSEMIMKHIRVKKNAELDSQTDFSNVLRLKNIKSS